jgi:hypothetical protein
MTKGKKKPANQLAQAAPRGLVNPFALPGIAQSPFPLPSDSDRIANRLREVIDKLFQPVPTLNKDEKAKATQAAADFAHAAKEILTFVDRREDEIRSRAVIDRALRAAEKYTGADDSSRIELQTKLDMLGKEQLIDYLLLACLASQSQQHTSYQSIERVRSEIKKTRALIARNEKDVGSNKTDVAVSHYVVRRWNENPKRRGNVSGTASDIMAGLNEELKRQGLKPLGIEAIRKRVRKIK